MARSRTGRWSLVVVVAGLIVAALAAPHAAGSSAAQHRPRSWALRVWGFHSARVGTSTPLRETASQRVLTLVAKDFVATQVDNNPAGLSQGDELAVNGRLYASGTPTGLLEVHEVATNATNHGYLLLTVATLLPRGAITASGVTRLNGPNHVRLAITGGTGHYVGAHGWILATPHNNNQTLLRYVLAH